METTVIFFLVSICASFFLAIFSNNLAQVIPFSGAAPDLLLISTLMIARSRSSNTAIFSAFLGGLALDGLSLLPLGFYALFYTLAAFLISLNRGRILSSSRLISFFLFILIVLIKIVYYYFVAALFKLFKISSYQVPPAIFLEAGLSIGVCAVFLLALHLFSRRRGLL